MELMEFLMKHKIRTHVLKLYSNRIGAQGLLSIAKYFQDAPFVRELHLTHNAIPIEAMIIFLEQLASNAKYPNRQSQSEAKGAGKKGGSFADTLDPGFGESFKTSLLF